MKIKHILLSLCILPMSLLGQQLPFYTQYMSSSLLWNPATAGTKKALDLRTSYRNQWLGFEGAPKTEYISINNRLLKGKCGAGAFIYKDETGPTSLMNYSGTFAAHLRFPDVEASLGFTGSLIQYTFQGQKATIHTVGDPAFDQTVTQRKMVPDVGLGFLLYNDRFHVGVSSMNLIGAKIKFRTNGTDSVAFQKTTLTPHTYISFGYNFSGNPNYVWENSFYANFATPNPISLAYSLRLFYKNKFITGTSIRTGDALALHLGFIFSESVQVCYSYDIVTGGTKKYNSGSHELFIAYSISRDKKRKPGNDDFQRQKYKYMF